MAVEGSPFDVPFKDIIDKLVTSIVRSKEALVKQHEELEEKAKADLDMARYNTNRYRAVLNQAVELRDKTIGALFNATREPNTVPPSGTSVYMPDDYDNGEARWQYHPLGFLLRGIVEKSDYGRRIAFRIENPKEELPFHWTAGDVYDIIVPPGVLPDAALGATITIPPEIYRKEALRVGGYINNDFRMYGNSGGDLILGRVASIKQVGSVYSRLPRGVETLEEARAEFAEKNCVLDYYAADEIRVDTAPDTKSASRRQ